MNVAAANALFDAAVAKLSPRLLAARGWVIHSATFPLLDISFTDPVRRALRLHVTCDDWNDMPPSVALLAPDGTPLTALPTLRPVPGGSIFNGSPHPRTQRPFVCSAGFREFHDHPSHRGDLWANYKMRDSFTLGSLLDKVWSAWAGVWP